MTKTTIFLAFFAMGLALPASAQDIAGSSEVFVRQFTDSRFDDEDPEFRFDAGADVRINSQFAFGANVGLRNADSQLLLAVDDDIATVTGHAMYVLSQDWAIGAYAAGDSAGDDEATTYGIEFGRASANSSFEVYFGAVDADDFFGDFDVTQGGVAFDARVGNGFELGFRYDSITIEDGIVPPGETELQDLSLFDFAFSAGYAFSPNISAHLELGRLSASADSASDDMFFVLRDPAEYVAIGADFTFGPAGSGGNTFGNRTVLGLGS